VAARRAHILITGRVQGVFYRASAAERASQLGLVGWVRNRDDGSVELEAEGDEGALLELVQWCQLGPPAAEVSAAQVTWIEPSGADRGFQVRR
jgi:acylphosphatase